MIESWKFRLNKSATSKHKAFGFHKNSVTFMKSYLTKRLQRKMNNSCSEWRKVRNGFPQRSISGPLLFNIILNDIFPSPQKCDLANYADDSSLHTSDKSISNIMNSLRHDFAILSKWFYNNFMVLNPDKRSVMLLEVHDQPQTNLVCGNGTIKKSK